MWPQESVQKMLDSIDRANPIGKLDYAILFMVTQLGLRDSDIQNLNSSHPDKDKASFGTAVKRRSWLCDY